MKVDLINKNYHESRPSTDAHNRTKHAYTSVDSPIIRKNVEGQQALSGHSPNLCNIEITKTPRAQIMISNRLL